jgi:acetyl-CoA C-acetyltransferase
MNGVFTPSATRPPIGFTGARVTVTMLDEILRRRPRRGFATLCVSGGLAMALELEAA